MTRWSTSSCSCFWAHFAFELISPGVQRCHQLGSDRKQQMCVHQAALSNPRLQQHRPQAHSQCLWGLESVSLRIILNHKKGQKVPQYVWCDSLEGHRDLMEDMRKTTTTEDEWLVLQDVCWCTYSCSHTGAVDANKLLDQNRYILNRQTAIFGWRDTDSQLIQPLWQISFIWCRFTENVRVYFSIYPTLAINTEENFLQTTLQTLGFSLMRRMCYSCPKAHRASVSIKNWKLVMHFNSLHFPHLCYEIANT